MLLSPPLVNECFFGLSWIIDPLCDQKRRAPWSTIPSRPNAEGVDPLREIGVILYAYREKGRMDTEQAKSTVVQYIVGFFFSFLFIIQTFFYFYNQ